jgi:hypothetical protein
MNKLSQKRLVDGMIEAYVSWREACLQVSDAYGSWASGTGLDSTSAFGGYMAALDREERVAEVYAGLLRRAGQVASSTPETTKSPPTRPPCPRRLMYGPSAANRLGGHDIPSPVVGRR